MADYYTRTVITSPVLLTDDLVSVLQLRGAECWPQYEQETVLDGIANGRMPMQKYSVTFEDGWNNQIEDYNTVDEWIEAEGHDEVNDEVKRLVVLVETLILREILKLNPDLDVIDQQSSWSCSKMRIDGFGGEGLFVTPAGYLYVQTGNVHVNEDGTVELASKFTAWKEEESCIPT